VEVNIVRLGKLLWVLAALATIGILAGCAGSGDGAEGEEETDVEYSLSYSETGIGKYDSFLWNTRMLIYELDQAQWAIDNVLPYGMRALAQINDVLAEGGEIAEDPAQAFQETVQSLADANVRLWFYIGGSGNVYFRVSVISGDEPDIITELEQAIVEVNRAVNTLFAVPDNLADAAQRATTLAEQAANLIESADSDFTGLNATKLPGALNDLRAAAGLLATVPDRVVTLAESAEQLVADLRTIASDE
jgi:hypothetical protein